jgi:hypothetical protein
VITYFSFPNPFVLLKTTQRCFSDAGIMYKLPHKKSRSSFVMGMEMLSFRKGIEIEIRLD